MLFCSPEISDFTLIFDPGLLHVGTNNSPNFWIDSTPNIGPVQMIYMKNYMKDDYLRKENLSSVAKRFEILFPA